jgi:hypothetical protein
VPLKAKYLINFPNRRDWRRHFHQNSYSQPVKYLYKTWMFINVFKKVRHWLDPVLRWLHPVLHLENIRFNRNIPYKEYSYQTLLCVPFLFIFSHKLYYLKNINHACIHCPVPSSSGYFLILRHKTSQNPLLRHPHFVLSAYSKKLNISLHKHRCKNTNLLETKPLILNSAFLELRFQTLIICVLVPQRVIKFLIRTNKQFNDWYSAM